MLYLYKPFDNVSMIKGGARNLSDGSRSSSISHFVQTVDEILSGNNGFFSIAEMVALVESDSSKSLVIYNEDHFLLHHPRDPNTDCIVINKESLYLYYTGNSSKEASNCLKFADGMLKNLDLRNPLAFIKSIEKYFVTSNSCKLQPSSAEETLFFVLDNKTGSIILGTQADEVGETFSSHVFEGTKIVPVVPEVKPVSEVKTESKPNMEEKTMSKVNAIVTANKTAAQTAVKIEAGNIALDKLAKLLSPRMPFGTSSYLKSPLGKVVMANLISFAINQYAANNPKAKIIGDAVMDAAALELVQSFNISALIDDLVGSINLTGLEEPTGLDKYAVKAE